MKITVIIPARAGSKGIPNKNIRIMNGKPLIWYALNTALSSKLISDVIVSTDSEEIMLIAKQMGARIHKRSPDLCSDAVTLDAVIYDAAGYIQSDYIITMQPTSPTLTTKTLDQAVRYALDGSWDTVISVCNRPHLAWVEEEGAFIPAYSERLNRQYLPPYYVETGAFVISRKEFIAEKSRIGNKVSIFEVPENEAVDIDSFQDWAAAERILSCDAVAFYVNGNNKLGLGHICRVLELADAFYAKPDIYYNKQQTDVDLFGNTAHTLIGLEKEDDLFEAVRGKEYRYFINDVLDTSPEYMEKLKKASGAKIINFEDDGDGVYHADLVFNALYSKEMAPHIKAGEKYYIPGRLFMFCEPVAVRSEAGHIFIGFGGADPQNYTDRLLNIICKEKYNRCQFTVVLGRAKENILVLLEYNKFSNISVLYDVKNMPEIMSGCDIGFTSRGRTGYELAMLGIPTIAMAQNKREEKHGFVSHENGFNYLGLNPPDSVIESNLDLYLGLSRADRQVIQNKLLAHDFRKGRNRVMNLIYGL